MTDSEFPDLTRCEKETLIALRAAGVVSAQQLIRLLNKDQDNVRKRLAVLVRKGYVVKVHLPKGYRYFAAAHSVDPALKSAIRDVLNSLIKDSSAEPFAKLPDLPGLPEVPEPPKLPKLPELQR